MTKRRTPRIGVVLWWAVAALVAPPAAVVTTAAVLGAGGSCYPGPTTLGCIGPTVLAVVVGVPAVVVGALWAGARLLSRNGSRPTTGTRMLRAHLTLVAVLSVAFVAALVITHVDDHGSVGSALLVGIGGIPLMGLGAPWTLLREFVLPDRSGVWYAVVELVAVVGPALLNVGVHAGLLRLLRRRRAGQAVGAGATASR